MIFDLESAVVPRPRTFLEFAEESLVIPGDGPFGGLTWTASRQPAQRLLFQEFDSGRWRRYAITGPTQTGKTLAAWVTPILYHLFERGQTVCAGVPMQDMAFDKWQQDVLPALQAGPFADQIRDSGPGSRGGKFTGIKFKNGSMLRFLGAGGSDKTVAGFTAPVLAATEVDGYDEVSRRSRESDKLTQMEGRLRAFGELARTYLECTVSIETGRIWQEWLQGSQAKIYLPCPECGAWITLERENLFGWQDAATEGEAFRGGHWRCGECAQRFDDEARAKAHQRAVLVHRGQIIQRDGSVTGELPDTATLGFRWSAGNNLFLTAGYLAEEEWRAARAADKDMANRKLCQQSWVIPPPEVKTFDEAITIESIEERALGMPRGLVPDWAELVTVGVDCGKRIHHWVAAAWGMNGDGQVIDYGIVDTNAEHLGEERGILNGLEQVSDYTLVGWTKQGGSTVPMDAGGVDSGGPGWDRLVYEFVRRHPKFHATKGQGLTQENRRRAYAAPRATSATILKVGEGYHFVRLPKPKRGTLLEFSADHFKTWVHSRLQTPDGQPGTLRVFGRPEEHKQFAAHLASEQEIVDKATGLPRWVRISRNNHFLDALVLAALVARTRGVAVVPTERTREGLPSPAPTSPAPAPRRGTVPHGSRVPMNKGRGKLRTRY